MFAGERASNCRILAKPPVFASCSELLRTAEALDCPQPRTLLVEDPDARYERLSHLLRRSARKKSQSYLAITQKW